MVQGNMQKQEWIVPVPSDLVDELRLSFRGGPIIDDTGRRLVQEVRVDKFNGLTVEIFSNEHPPPHFRVSYGRESANFRIRDCEPLTPGLAGWRKNTAAWHKDNKLKLIKVWNETRPTGCPVGPYRE